MKTPTPHLIAEIGAIAADIHAGGNHQEADDEQIVTVDYDHHRRHFRAACTRYACASRRPDPETGQRDYCEIEESYSASSLLALARQIQDDGWI